MQNIQDCFALEQLARFAARCIDQINSVGVQRFPALGAGVAEEGDALAVRRCLELFNAPRRGGELLGMRGQVAGFGWACGEAISRIRQIDAVDGVAALGLTELDHVFPVLLVRLLLVLGPCCAAGEIDLAGIGRPGEGVDFLVSFRDGERLATVE